LSSIDFLNVSPQREREFFVARLKGPIAKVAQDLCSFLLASAAIVDNVFRKRLVFELLLATTNRL